MTWLTALALGLLALVAAGMAGWTWRGAQANHPGSRAALVLPALLVAGWAGLGLLLLMLRLRVSDVATTAAYEGSGPVTESGSFDATAAGILLAVHVLCGALTFADLYHWYDDAHAAGRAAEVAPEATRDQLSDRERTDRHLLANHHERAADLARLDEEARIARRRDATFAAELEQHVRDEIAVGLADPATAGIMSPRHPDPAARTMRADHEEGDA